MVGYQNCKMSSSELIKVINWLSWQEFAIKRWKGWHEELSHLELISMEDYINPSYASNDGTANEQKSKHVKCKSKTLGVRKGTDSRI